MSLPTSIKFLFESGHRAVSADNSQPWLFTWNGEKILISYNIERAPKSYFLPDGIASLLSFGSVIENMTQAANSIDLKIEWIIQPINTDKYTFAEGIIIHNGVLEKANYGHDLFKRHTNRFPFKNKLLPSDALEFLKNEKEGKAYSIVIDKKYKINEVAKLVRDSSKIRFLTKEIHDWFHKHLHFKASEVDKGSGIDVKTMNLPFGGVTFMKLTKPWKCLNLLSKFGIGNFLANQEQIPIKNAPTLIAIIGEKGFKEGISAGILMQRIWIKLNTIGIAVQPFFVITDVLDRHNENKVPPCFKDLANSISKENKRMFNLKESEKLVMLLRVGYPKIDPIKAKRIPLNLVYKDVSSKN